MLSEFCADQSTWFYDPLSLVFGECWITFFIIASPPIHWVCLLLGIFCPVPTTKCSVGILLNTDSQQFNRMLASTCGWQVLYGLLRWVSSAPATAHVDQYANILLILQGSHTAWRFMTDSDEQLYFWTLVRGLFALDWFVHLLFLSQTKSVLFQLNFIVLTCQTFVIPIKWYWMNPSLYFPDVVRVAPAGADFLFLWTWPALHQSYFASGFTTSDVPALVPQDDPTILNQQFEIAWESQERGQKCLWKALLSVCTQPFLQSAMYLFISTIANISSPVVLKLLLDFVQTHNAKEQDLSIGYGLVVLFCFCLLIKSLFEHQFWIQGIRCGMQIRSILWFQVYHRCHLSSSTLTRASLGKIQNLMATDASYVCDNNIACTLHWGTWSACITVSISMVMVVRLLSISACASWLLLTLSTIPLSHYFQRQLRPIAALVQEQRDGRSEHLTSSLPHLNILRSASSSRFRRQVSHDIEACREHELRLVREKKTLEVMSQCFVSVIQLLAPVMSLCSFMYIEGRDLDPSTAFAALAWFQLSFTPLVRCTRVLVKLTSSRMAFERLEACFITLSAPVSSPHSSSSSMKIMLEDKRYQLHTGPVLLSKETPSRLLFHELHLDIPFRDLVMIRGSAGSGKSKLLETMLGQTYCCSMDDDDDDDGTLPSLALFPVAYCAQTPWLDPTVSIQQNIVYSSAYDAIRFHDVLFVCHLIDEHEKNLSIGSLSTGQQQRVAIARAAYSTTTYGVFIDNSFTCLDPTVRQHVWKHGVLDWMSNRTRIVVDQHGEELMTHPENECGMTDQVITIENQQCRTEKCTKRVANSVRHDENEAKTMMAMLVVAKQPIEQKWTQQQYPRTAAAAAAEEDDIENLKSFQAQRWIYRYLVHFGGPVFRTIVLLMCLMYPICSILTTHALSLSNWTTFLRMSLIQALFFCTRYGFVFLVGALRSSRVIHTDLMDSIFHSGHLVAIESAFSSGQLMNVCLNDMLQIDEQVPVFLFGVVESISQVSCSLFVLVWKTSFFSRPDNDYPPSQIRLILVAVAHTCMIVLVLVVMNFPYYWIYQYYRSSAHDLKRLERHSQSPILNQFTHSCSGVGKMTIRAYQSYPHHQHEMVQHIRWASQTFWMFWNCNQWVTVWLELWGICIIGVISWINVSSLSHSSSSSFLGMILFFAFTVPSQVGWTMKQWTNCEIECISLERVFGLQDQIISAYHEDEISIVVKSNCPNDTSRYVLISIENLWMQYHHGSDWILKNITLDIKRHSSVVITGSTGSGKSTLLHCLLGIYPTQRGHIIVTPELLVRHHWAYISSSPVLLGRTVRESLLTTTPIDLDQEHDDEALWAVLTQVQMYDKIQALPFQLNTRVVSAELSVGEIQLLNVARVLLPSNAITIVMGDEITASLDPQTSALVYDLVLSKSSTTVILTSHQLSWVSRFDVHVELCQGELVRVSEAKQDSYICAN